MNRIKALREAKGLNATQLAKAIGTTQVQMSRLENGQRKLTQEWMVKISSALKCRPTELISGAPIEFDTSDVEHIPFPEEDDFCKELTGCGLEQWIVRNASLSLLGIEKGRRLLVKKREDEIAKIKTGDIAILKATNSDGSNHHLMRVFVSPGIFTTAMQAANVSFTPLELRCEIKIEGIVVRSQ